MTQKLVNFKKKLTDLNRDKYITAPEFSMFAADVFNARLAQVNLVTKTDFDAKLQLLIEKLLRINKNICLLKMN